MFLKTGQVLSCLKAETGETLYRSDLPGATKIEDSPTEMTPYYPGRLVAGNGVVLCTYGARSPAKLSSSTEIITSAESIAARRYPTFRRWMQS